MSKRLLHRDKLEGLRASPGKAPEVIADPESVSVTEAAWQEIRQQAAIESKKQNGTPRAIRVGLRGGGCSGYTYTFEWDYKDPREKDTVLTNQESVVYIDHRSMKLLKGTVLDYHRTLMNRGFKFHNPNSTGTCGCGESTSF